MDALNPAFKPAFQSRAALPTWQEKDAKPDFTDYDGIYSNFALVVSQPLDHSVHRIWLGGFAENVCIN
jgi:hypothetical protein